jgi:tetratricopeptide (TPR) repeat protein
MLGEHGETTHMYFIYQSAIKVPLIFKLPGSRAAHRIDDLASIIDIVPTLCDLLAIDPPAGIQGKNLAPYFGNKPPLSEDRYLYCESLHPTKYEANSLLGLVSKQWKYIQTTRPELYNLQEDPEEHTNLVKAEPQRARIFKEHLALILEQTARQGEDLKDTPLDPESLKHLRSLGYVGGSGVKEDFSFDQNKTDPKDLIGFHNEYRKTMHLIERNELADARALGEQLLKQHSGIPRLYESLSGVALNQKDFAHAIRYGEKALALKPGRMEVHYNLGVAYLESQHNEAAAQQFERVLELMPEDQTAFLAKRVQVHNRLGLLRSRQKKYDLAIVQFNETLKLNPKQPFTLNTLAWILVNCPDQALRDPSKALRLAQQACALTQSRHPVYLNTLAAVHEALHHFEEAVKVSERALALAQAKGDQALVGKLQKQLDQLRKALADSN